jgi:hypothetical protein
VSEVEWEAASAAWLEEASEVDWVVASAACVMLVDLVTGFIEEFLTPDSLSQFLSKSAFPAFVTRNRSNNGE